MPPTSRRQQKFVFAKAREGVPWAKRWVSEGKMKVRKHNRESAKARLVRKRAGKLKRPYGGNVPKGVHKKRRRR